MPKHRENDTWKGKATDIAYKEPFSDSTNKTRKLVIFWGSITLLNHFYPTDLENSHVLGLKFAKGIAPPIDALLGLVAIYLLLTFSIYVYQEIKSWLAQANEVALSEYRRSPHDIYAHHTNISAAINSATQTLGSHSEATIKLTAAAEQSGQISPEALEKHFIEVLAHKGSLENFSRNLGEATEKYGAEIAKATTLLAQVSNDYKRALMSQLIKVGVLEVAAPLLLGGAAVFVSFNNVYGLVKAIFT